MPAQRLPSPSPDALALSRRLTDLIRDDIAAHAGWISFARYMELALYAPGLGYYSAGSHKLGAGGDFITAPESGSLFARTLAHQLRELLDADVPDLLELGAGTGALAADLLAELARLGALPERYLILEVSAELRERQRQTLAARAAPWIDRIVWLDVLPAHLQAIVIGNEVLDAVPAHIVRQARDSVLEVGVATHAQGFAWDTRPASGELLDAAQGLALPAGYQTEINLAAPALVQSLARLLERGALLFIDYGFPAREFYHPERSSGTLMCHYRHHAHDDPFMYPGLQDITAHVDFTAIASAAVAAGVEVLGYATQANFLVNCGITELLSAVSPEDVARYGPLASEAQRLLSPSEMGERFKVIAFGKGLDLPLRGFQRGDKSHTL